MRKGRLNHGADLVIGILIILATWFLFTDAEEKDPVGAASAENLMELGPIYADTTIFTTNFLSKQIHQSEYPDYLTGQETYGDLLALAEIDKKNRDVYVETFDKGIMRYFLKIGGYHKGNYAITFTDKTVEVSYGFDLEGATEYLIPYKDGKVISLKVKYG